MTNLLQGVDGGGGGGGEGDGAHGGMGGGGGVAADVREVDGFGGTVGILKDMVNGHDALPLCRDLCLVLRVSRLPRASDPRGMARSEEGVAAGEGL